jgi:hypothetical protein
MLKQWEIEYILDLIEDEQKRCEKKQTEGINRSLHLKDLKELRDTILKIEHE